MKTIISTHPFLKGLSPRHVQTLIDSAMPLEFEANQTIFHEGDPANRFYLIQSGKVALETSAQDGKPGLIQTLGAGDVLGWSWLFPPYYWHFHARATEPSKAIFFYGSRLREQCEGDHDLGYELMKRMAGIVINRLQATRKQLLEARKSSS
ncbi:MAG: Crp/Fnr family transcriptional regulator [Verrucomicrobiota bacterium]